MPTKPTKTQKARKPKRSTLTITLTITGDEEQARTALRKILDAGVVQDAITEHVDLVDGGPRFTIEEASLTRG